MIVGNSRKRGLQNGLVGSIFAPRVTGSIFSPRVTGSIFAPQVTGSIFAPRVTGADVLTCQGKFRSSERIEAVKLWVDGCINTPDRIYHLSTMPPVRKVRRFPSLSRAQLCST